MLSRVKLQYDGNFCSVVQDVIVHESHLFAQRDSDAMYLPFDIPPLANLRASATQIIYTLSN